MIRFATIGTGWIVRAFLQGAGTVPELRWSHCYSRTMERAEAFGGHQVRLWDDLEKLAACPDLDAVYIASPNSLHAAQSRLFLEHGKHVLCEKPAALSLKEQQELVTLAGEKNLVYGEAMMTAHLPQLAVLRQLLQKVGPLHTVRLDFSQYSSRYPALLAGERPNVFLPEMGGGALLDLGVYCISLAASLWGRPEKVTGWQRLLPTGADGSGGAVLHYGDFDGVLTWSKTCSGTEGVQICGENGTITGDSVSMLSRLTWQERGKEPEIWTGPSTHGEAMAWEAAHFAEAVLNPNGHDRMDSWNQLSLLVREITEQVRHSAAIQ